MMRAVTKVSDTQLEQKIKELAKPGVVFGEPFRQGDYTIITASRVKARPNLLVARPIGAILVSRKGVEFRRFHHPAARVLTLGLIAAMVFWLAMMLNPPWKPEASLLGQVQELIREIRGKSEKSISDKSISEK